MASFLLFRPCEYLNVIGYKDVIGYCHVCSTSLPLSRESLQRPSLLFRGLEENHYHIGMEKLIATNYAAARKLRDAPQFFDDLEVCYPEVVRVTLEQYEMGKVEEVILHTLRMDFTGYVHTLNRGPGYLISGELLETEARYRECPLLDYQRTLVKGKPLLTMCSAVLPTMSPGSHLPSV